LPPLDPRKIAHTKLLTRGENWEKGPTLKTFFPVYAEKNLRASFGAKKYHYFEIIFERAELCKNWHKILIHFPS
jgi:hypothetical protein